MFPKTKQNKPMGPLCLMVPVVCSSCCPEAAKKKLRRDHEEPRCQVWDGSERKESLEEIFQPGLKPHFLCREQPSLSACRHSPTPTPSEPLFCPTGRAGSVGKLTLAKESFVHTGLGSL